MSKSAFFMLLVALVLVGYLNYRHCANARSLLRAWAEANRFRLLHARPGMPPWSMLLTTSKSQVVYHVSVHDESSHRIRAAWVRLGTRFWGVVEGDAVEVKWDSERWHHRRPARTRRPR